MRRVCRSKKNKKQDKQEENVLLLLVAAAAAAAAVGDPHSLLYKMVTLPTSQPPMGWLKALALLNAAWDRGVIRTHAGIPQQKKEGKKKENITENMKI